MIAGVSVICAAAPPLPVYASEATMNDLKRVFAYAFNGGPISRGYFIRIPG